MAIPSLITSTFASIAGEFAKSTGPFMEPLNFDSSFVPDGLLNLPSSFKLPSINEFQGAMMKTILTDGGRLELFKNPLSGDILDIRGKLSDLISGAGTDPSIIAASVDMLQTLDHFEDHTDRLSGVVEPDSASAQYPTLERALAVGGSLTHIHQQLDAAVATNAPTLSLFGSFFEGKSHIDALKNMLGNPASIIDPSALTALSGNLIKNIENDVSNYTVGLKKLKRMAIANIVFSGKDKQVDGGLMDSLFATDKTKGLFASDANQRNADQVSASQRALDARSAARSVTDNPTARDYKTADDLLQPGGLFDGIQLTPAVLAKMKLEWPANQPGLFNEFLDTSFGSITTQDQIDKWFSDRLNRTHDPYIKGLILYTLYLDWLSRKGAESHKGDLYWGGFRRLGALNKVLVQRVLTNAGFDLGSESTMGPFFQDGNGNLVPLTANQEEELRQGVFFNRELTTFKPYLVIMRIAGVSVSLEAYIGTLCFIIPDNPLIPLGAVYRNGGWYPA